MLSYRQPVGVMVYNNSTILGVPWETVFKMFRKKLGTDSFDSLEEYGDKLIQYIEFPQALVGKYQSYTQADLSALRAVGCEHPFADVQTGVTAYMRWLSTGKS